MASDVRMSPTNETNGVNTYWIVVGMYKSYGCPLVYAHVRPLQRCNDANSNANARESLEPLYEVYSGPSSIVVRLNEHCSRTLLLHCCGETRHCHCRGTFCTTKLLAVGELGVDILSCGRWAVHVSRHFFLRRRLDGKDFSTKNRIHHHLGHKNFTWR